MACLISAIVLSVYLDSQGKPGGAVESSIENIWRAFSGLIGALIGFLAGPPLAVRNR
jgi:hypothetical protein